MAYMNGNQILNVNVSGLVAIDHIYNPESENPQSGIAVAEALSDIQNPIKVEVIEKIQEDISNLQQNVEVDIFPALNEINADMAKRYEGTKVFTDVNTTNGYVSIGEIISGTNTSGKVDEFFLNLKVGDFYYNTEENKTYLCLNVEINEMQTSAMSKWLDLSLAPDIVYNPKSLNAQSGKAIAEAVADKMNKFGEVENDGTDYTVTSAEDGTFTLKGGLLCLEDLGGGVQINSSSREISIYSPYGVSFNEQRLMNVFEPINDSDAANKKYVDDAIGDIETALDSIIAIQESLIGGASE